jgi:predicted TIM-barrel fold metal-dependent hydrolase
MNATPLPADHELATAPLCAGPDPNPRKPRVVLPPLACDCHAHIFGPRAVYPYSPRRIYTPPDAPLSSYLHLLGVLGVERMVLVQPSVYGTDNRVTLNAMKELGARCRGVAVVEDAISDAELERMHAAGMRGVRINVVDVAECKGVVPMAPLRRIAERIKPLGWHVEFLMHADEFHDIARQFADFPVEVVLGHLGYMRTDRGLANPGFRGLLALMREARAWVKLTGPYRIATSEMPYPDVTPYAHALIEAAPGQVIWGTDWPHPKHDKAMPNDGEMCDRLIEWVPDEAIRRRVLVENPARLYGW